MYFILIYHWILLVPLNIAHRMYTIQVSEGIPDHKICGRVSMIHSSKKHFQSTTMTSHQNTFRFPTGPYHGTADDLYYKIIRYCQTIEKPLLIKKMTIWMVWSYTRSRISCIHSKWKPEDIPTIKIWTGLS